MARLSGKVAVVTGAGRAGNIGVAVCDAFLREGAAGVVATDLRVDAAGEIAAALEAEHGAGRFLLLEHDVTSEDGWSRVVERTRAAFGHLDVLVNNAGISIHGGFLDTSLGDLRKVMAVNHDAIFLGIRACLPLLERAHERHAGGGSVINTLSMGSYVPNANNIGYQSSKAAGRMLTMCAAIELGPRRVRVNSIHPGVTMTPLMRAGMAGYVERGVWASIEEAESSMAAMSPLGTNSEPSDVAQAFVYLASDESRYVTGSALCHDGGFGQRY